MNKQTLTPWFPMSTPPVRKGVYNVSCQDNNQSGTFYSYFDGKGFHSSYWKNPGDADTCIKGGYNGTYTKSWRGIIQ